MTALDGSPVAPDWAEQARSLQSRFREAKPFPHLILDRFLVPESADALLAEFPGVDAMPRSRDYVFGNKHELSSVETAGAASAALHRGLLSEAFQGFLREATGYDVFVDPTFFGGGFYQGGDGSFLDMHVDFNVHPEHPDWLRTLNVLLYLNTGWHEEFGGQLLVKASVDEAPVEIAPLFNRCVIMLTYDHTYHG